MHFIQTMFFKLNQNETCSLEINIWDISLQVESGDPNHVCHKRVPVFKLEIMHVHSTYKHLTVRVQDYLDSKTRYRNDVIMSLRFGYLPLKRKAPSKKKKFIMPNY